MRLLHHVLLPRLGHMLTRVILRLYTTLHRLEWRLCMLFNKLLSFCVWGFPGRDGEVLVVGGWRTTGVCWVLGGEVRERALCDDGN